MFLDAFLLAFFGRILDCAKGLVVLFLTSPVFPLVFFKWRSGPMYWLFQSVSHEVQRYVGFVYNFFSIVSPFRNVFAPFYTQDPWQTKTQLVPNLTNTFAASFTNSHIGVVARLVPKRSELLFPRTLDETNEYKTFWAKTVPFMGRTGRIHGPCVHLRLQCKWKTVQGEKHLDTDQISAGKLRASHFSKYREHKQWSAMDIKENIYI